MPHFIAVTAGRGSTDLVGVTGAVGVPVAAELGGGVVNISAEKESTRRNVAGIPSSKRVIVFPVTLYCQAIDRPSKFIFTIWLLTS